MPKIALICLGLCLVTVCQAISEKEFDFDFKDMDLYSATQSIAKLEGRNVIFGRGVENKPVTMTLNQVSPEFALQLLLESHGYTYKIREGIVYVVPEGERTPQGTADNPNITSVIPLVNVIAKDVEPNVKSFLGTRGSYSINEQLNAFIINAPEETMRQVKQLITQMDQQLTQILIEAKIIETTTSFLRKLGVDWGNRALRSSNGQGGSTQGPVTGINYGSGVSVSAFDTGNPLVAGLSAAISSHSQLEAELLAAESNGDAKMISSPKIATLNGTPATITSATTFTFKTLVSTGTQAGAVSQGPTSSVRAGLTFTVTPFVVSEEEVRLNINITKSDPGQTDVDGIPQILENTAQTALIVRNGETASIGGLVTQKAENKTMGVPFLSNIPILGALFGSLSKSKDTSELIIFMTPTIYRGGRRVVTASHQAKVSETNRPSKSEALNTLRGTQPSFPVIRASAATLLPQGGTADTDERTETAQALAQRDPASTKKENAEAASKSAPVQTLLKQGQSDQKPSEAP